MTFKISVVMPVYNAEKELNAAIDSIINQSLGFENIELIIVDDCSTDNSRNIISDYANEYDNIVPVFLDENSGLPGKPRSLGIKYASADYISFLDSDDEYLKDGDIIVKPDSSSTYRVGTDKDKLTGVYNINKGYAVFKQIKVLASNDDYTIVEAKTPYGISLYDHIALDGKSVKENQTITK